MGRQEFGREGSGRQEAAKAPRTFVAPAVVVAAAAVRSRRRSRAQLDTQQQAAGSGKESGAVERAPLDTQQQAAGSGKESEAVERALRIKRNQGSGSRGKPFEDDEQRRARLARRAEHNHRYYQKRRADSEWTAARAAKRAERQRPSDPPDPQRISTLMQLLDVVLEVEQWDAARHGRYTGRAWRQCGD